jgi:tetratricopeptide (TPR) repeat protein
MPRRWIALPFLLCAALAGPLWAQRMKLPLSLKELEARVAKDSLDPAAHYNVALAYWNEKRYDDVERELKLAAAMDPKFAEAYLALAFLPYARRPKLWNEKYEDKVPQELKAAAEESDRMYRRAFLVSPLVDMRIIGAASPRSGGGSVVGGFYDFYFQSFDDVMEGNYEQAYGRFVRMHRERRLAGPGQPKLPLSFRWFEALAAAHTKRYDEAAESFQMLIDQSIADERKLEEKELVRIPLRTNEYRYFLATVRQAAGQKDKALELFQQVLEADIGLYMAHVQRANIYESDRRYAEALEERQRAINANPDDPSLLTDLGVTLGKSGKWQEAEETLKQAAEANPRDPRPYFWMGLCQVEQGKSAEAKASLTRFVATAPSRWETQINLANQRLARLN